MREISFVLNVQPLSVNNSKTPIKRGKFVTMIKTSEAREFEIKCFNELANYKDLLDEFSSNFDPHSHVIHCSLFFYVPIGKFYTGKTKKKISSHSKDLDNMLKYTIDPIFSFLGINDCYVVKLEAEKVATTKEDWCVVVQLFIRPLFILEH